jgi:thiosulfate dehydrogenase (quinone) large subunit
MLGLSNAPSEWEWSYILMVLLAIAMFGVAPGRYFGLDMLLRPRFRALSERGSRLGRLLLLFT